MLPYIKIFRRKQQGLALLMVLVFMQLFALLGLMLLRKNTVQTKQIAMLWQKQQIRVAADFILSQAEYQLRESVPSCLIPAMDVSKITQKERAWWQGISCAGNFQGFQYYYVVEFLGKDNCSYFKENHKNIAYFYRVSLLMFSEKPDETASPRVILQSVFLTKGLPTEICKWAPHDVEDGQQDWNELV